MRLFISSLGNSSQPIVTYNPTALKMSAINKDHIWVDYTTDFTVSTTWEFSVKTLDAPYIFTQNVGSTTTYMIVGNTPSKICQIGGVFCGTKSKLFDDEWHDVVIHYDSSIRNVSIYIDGVHDETSGGITIQTPNYPMRINARPSVDNTEGDMLLKNFRIYEGDKLESELINLNPTLAVRRYDTDVNNKYTFKDTSGNLADGEIYTIDDSNKMMIDDLGIQQAPDGEFKYKIIVDMGQSNTLFGWRLRDEVDYSPRAMVKQHGRYAPYIDDTILAAEPLDTWTKAESNGGIGHGLEFCKHLIDNDELSGTEQLIIIPCGYGGSSFSAGDWRVGDPLLEDAVAKTNRFCANNPNAEVMAFIWHQGESDASAVAGTTYYRTELLQMIDSLRARVTGANSTTPFVCGQMVPEWTTAQGQKAADIDIVHTTISDYKNESACASSLLPTIITDNFDDMIHYDAKGQIKLGLRYYTAFKTI